MGTMQNTVDHVIDPLRLANLCLSCRKRAC